MREKSRKSEDEICWNLGSGKISKSQEKKNLGIIEGEKILESSKDKNLGILSRKNFGILESQILEILES
jgi:hypothetical protein